MLNRAVFVSLMMIAPSFGQDPVADFSLADLNLSSPRSGEMVSPRDYRHQVTSYYFGDPG